MRKTKKMRRRKAENEEEEEKNGRKIGGGGNEEGRGRGDWMLTPCELQSLLDVNTQSVTVVTRC